MALTAAERDSIVKLTVGIFNAAPGNTYLSEFTNFFEANGRSLTNLANYLAGSSTYKSVYGSFQLASEFASTFLTPLGLQANSVAVEFVTSRFNAGASTQSIMLAAIQALDSTTDSAFTAAKAILNNKTSVATTYSLTSGATTLAALQSVVSSVDATVASVTAANNANSSASGNAFTLTTGVDTSGIMVGSNGTTSTAGNDTFNAYVNTTTATVGQTTLTAVDTLNGGAGIDRLVLTTEGVNAAGSLTAATITGIEEFQIRDVNTNGASTYDFVNVTGETLVINDRSTQAVILSNLGTGTVLQISGNGAVTNGNTTFTGLSGTQAFTINLDGGVTAGNITRNTTGAAALTINSTGGTTGNNTGTIDLDTATAVTSLTINATTRLTTTLAADFAATAVVTLNGAALIDLTGSTVTVGTGVITALGTTALSANILTINAAGNSGGTRSVMGANTVTFTGGTGNDFVSAAALVFNSSGSLAGGGGTGTDTIVVQDAAQLTSTTAAKMTGFELLRLNDDNDGALDTFDSSLLTGLTGIVIGAQSAGDGVTITNMTAALAGNVLITGTQDVLPTFTVTGATNVGQLDVLGLTISDELAANNTITLVNIGAAGIETINITATDSVTISSLTSATALASMTFAASARNVSVTTGALALGANTTINASSITGTVTLDATDATGNGIALTGGTGVATLTGSAQGDTITGGSNNDGLSGLAGNDIIIGGAGTDTITGGAGADTMTGGDGFDAFVFTTLANTQNGYAAGDSTAANIDKITDFVGNGSSVGDTINITASSVIATGVTTGAAGAHTSTIAVSARTVTTASTFTALTAAAQAITAGTASVTGNNGLIQAYDITVSAGTLAGRYLIINDTTAAIAATDTIISLTGITGALNAADFVLNV
jgi:hypothetical protein